jgi:hypothetical protein
MEEQETPDQLQPLIPTETENKDSNDKMVNHRDFDSKDVDVSTNRYKYIMLIII